jgi:hypothetical protein
MTIELRLLVASAVLGLVQFEALAASLQKMSETVERSGSYQESLKRSREMTRSNQGARDNYVIQTTGFASPNDFVSAIFATLPNGNYTAVVSGKNGATGVGLVEVYKVAVATNK